MKGYFLVIIMSLCSVCTCAQSGSSDQLREKAESLSLDGKYAQSLIFYQKAYELVKTSDPARAANLCNDISSAYHADAHYKKSIYYCRLGLGHLKKRQSVPDSLYFKLYSSLGTMHGALHQTDSAYYYFRSADRVLERTPSVEKDIPLYVLHHYLHQGRSFWTLHRYYQSIAYFSKAARLSEQYNLDNEFDYIQSSLAEGYDLLGKHREALKFRFLAAQNKFLDSRRRQELNSGIAYTYQKLGKLDSALVWYGFSWELHLQQPDNTDHFKKQHLNLMLLMASCHRQSGDYSRASTLLENANLYQLNKLGYDSWFRCNLLTEMSLLKKGRSDYDGARKNIDEILAIASLSHSMEAMKASDLIFPHFVLNALAVQASIFLEQYNVSKSEAYLESAYRSYKKLISLKSETDFEAATDIQERYNFSSQNKDILKDAIPVAYKLYQKRPSPAFLQEIFELFEKANTSYLYEVIKDKSWQLKVQPESFLRQENKFIAQRSAILEKFKGNTFSPGLKKELADLNIKWYKFSATHKKKPSQQQQIAYDTIQKKLDEESAYICYKWLDDTIFAFILTKQAAELTSWKVDGKLLFSDLDKLKGEFNYNPGFGIYSAKISSVNCYKSLVEPLRYWIANKDRLVIARDWQFSFLPFELLETGKRNNDYLIKHHSISYAYSASLFYLHPFSKKPQFSKANADELSLTVAPFVYEQKEFEKKNESDWTQISTLKDLNEIGGRKLWGQDATKQQFLKNGFGNYILHLATHAKVDDQNPDDSFIQFYSSADSRLYLSELYQLPLHKTRLTILSSCSGGLGRSVSGEGNISLAHAVCQAGCPSVVSTVWEANDQVINYLSKLLYKYLKQGLSVDKAMQRAKLDFFENKDYRKFSHPYYWANFTLVGNNEPIYEMGLSNTAKAVLILSAVTLIFGLFYFLRQFKKVKI